MIFRFRLRVPTSLLYFGILLCANNAVTESVRAEAIAPSEDSVGKEYQSLVEQGLTPISSDSSSVIGLDPTEIASLGEIRDEGNPKVNLPLNQRVLTAQTIPNINAQIPGGLTDPVPLPPRPPSIEPSDPPEPPQKLPPPSELLQPGPTAPQPQPGEDVPDVIRVERFEILGSTVFSEEEWAEVTAPFTNRSISFAELLEVRSLITQHYIDRGYITTGALIPPQELSDGVVQIQVVEGGVEDINVTGTTRLNPGYVRSRLGLATDPPLNIEQLREALQLLQLNPLIGTISAELSAGTTVGTNILDVEVTEADTLSLEAALNNGRSPNVGSFRRGVSFTEANLLGLGDSISASFFNTDGSNSLDLSYTLPINPRNGTVRFSFGTSLSRVIDPDFEVLDIRSRSRFFELTLRQPILQSPAQELALGFTISRQESQSILGLDNIGGFPISAGADNEGRTKVTALRFFQDWVKRSEQQVFAARSQFSLGVNWFDATDNNGSPESTFASWRGQAQWVRLLAPDTLLFVRTDVQLSDRPLLTLEQFSLGGIDSVRGYRQDFLLQDNGWFISTEARIPILRIPEIEGVLQVTPFIDFGVGWSNLDNSSAETIAGLGLGLRWQQGDRLTMRLDWGIPLKDRPTRRRSWQENGLYFSVNYRLF
ncbi:ShlB/FhaC/HecB family hemolysin secretion/activation protein [Lusitaniella coriacea LEGE 07157]|uniref:ShlB/FhaC/HecB family hemolysin secretion/activation protein n=1 Tax=Lusitaniella coriacea LEGE 07157 TaxID=945747 RepID=A0A8J7DV34_9CYAN|nr:ShlB/FhaC/HecB family hemolysin secretion/activation protein [Lusitaniella coriacea LEGE 07157]